MILNGNQTQDYRYRYSKCRQKWDSFQITIQLTNPKSTISVHNVIPPWWGKMQRIYNFFIKMLIFLMIATKMDGLFWEPAGMENYELLVHKLTGPTKLLWSIDGTKSQLCSLYQHLPYSNDETTSTRDGIGCLFFNIKSESFKATQKICSRSYTFFKVPVQWLGSVNIS